MTSRLVRKRKSVEALPNDKDDRKIMKENRPPSGLVVPGFAAKRSGKPHPIETNRKVKEDLSAASSVDKLDNCVEVKAPCDTNQNKLDALLQDFSIPTIDGIISDAFGQKHERDAVLELLLKRHPPQQRLYGYPKKYALEETKRLATGIKDQSAKIEKFFELCRSYERDCERRHNAFVSYVTTLEKDVIETGALRGQYEKEMVSLQKSNADLSSQCSQLKADLSALAEKHNNTEEIRNGLIDDKSAYEATVQKLKTELENQAHKMVNLEAKFLESERRCEEAKTELRNQENFRIKEDEKVKGDFNLRMQMLEEKHRNELTEIKDDLSAQLERAHQARKTDLEKLEKDLRSQALKEEARMRDSFDQAKISSEEKLSQEMERRSLVERDLERVQDELKNLSKLSEDQRVEVGQLRERLAAKATEEALIQEELASIRATNEVITRQLNASESDKEAKNSHFHKAMDTFQTAQTYLQEQNAQLITEKAKLEVRMETTANEKSELALEVAQLRNEVKEYEESTKLLKEKLESTEQQLTYASSTALEVKSSSSEAIAKLEGNLEAVTRENASLSVKSDRLVIELENEKKSRSEDVRGISDKLATAEAEIEELVSRRETLESEVLALKSSLDFAVANESKSEEVSSEQISKLTEISKEAELLKRQLVGTERLAQELAESRAALRQAEQMVFELDKKRRALHNEVQSLRGKIRVVARIRPVIRVRPEDEETMEISAQVPEFYKSNTEKSRLCISMQQETAIGSTHAKEHDFSLDHVFMPGTTQAAVFDEVACFVQSALDGYNVCLFSYGQTGSGKTWTMTGKHACLNNRGIIPRSIDQILSYQMERRAEGWEYTLEASYVEIYNEGIYDLLKRGGKSAREKLEIRDSKKEILVNNAVRMPVGDKEEVNRILDLAEACRSVASTNSNMHSSRSHSIFTLFIKGVNKEFREKVSGSLSLCDLAGSERISKSKATGDRLKEAQSINKSLSALAKVFSALASKDQHIPYRNSKLTHMLQPCMSGEGKAMMIVNLSPDEQDKGESLCSLRFASTVSSTELGRAKKQISSIDS